MRLRSGARVAVIGAGPGGLAAAKHALEAGFDVSVFEASDDLGGQWHTTAAHSGIWPRMQTNTSRALTAFSDHPYPPDHALHPAATQIHAYLQTYADRFGVTDRIRFGAPVSEVAPAWTVDGEPFDAVVLASGRFRKPSYPPGLDGFAGETLHAFDYPGHEHFADRRTLVYGNGVSGLEIAADAARAAPVVSAFRKPRYVIEKNVDGVSSDWQWYTMAGALERRCLPPDEVARRMRERILRVAGNPADFGAPEPDPDVRVAGVSLCQGYLGLIADGRVVPRPGIESIAGREVTFTDGSVEAVDAIVVATGYELDLPYLDPELAGMLDTGGPAPALYGQTLHPALPTLGVVGQFLLQGPFFPLLELQARWIAGLWSGAMMPPSNAEMRAAMATPRPPIEAHNTLALLFSEASGVAPDVRGRPDLAEPLLFGPMLPPRYRLDGPGADPGAGERFTEQLVASPRVPPGPDDLEGLAELDYGDVGERLLA